MAGSLIERTRLARQNDSLVKELSARNEELEIAMAELRRTHHRMASGVQLDAIGRTMAMVVHDLRGPLNTIGMATSQLAQSGDDPAGRAETARIASEEVQRLGQLCEELIEVSRAGSESLRYDDTPLDETLQLKDFPTLNHAVGFVKDRMPGEAPDAVVEAAPSASEGDRPSASPA